MEKEKDYRITQYFEWKKQYPLYFFEHVDGVYAKLMMALNERTLYLKLIENWTPDGTHSLERLHTRLNIALNNILYFSAFIAEEHKYTKAFLQAQKEQDCM